MASQSATHGQFKYGALTVIILCGLGLIIYSNALYNSFHWDDNPSIIKNFSIRTLSSLAPIFNFWPTRFLTYLTFALDYRLHQLHVFGYHLVNLIIHVCSALLAWRLALLFFATPAMAQERISRYKNLIAAFVGMVFVAHPLQTQAVTYITQRCASLATLLYLASLVLYIQSRLLQERAHALALRRWYYAGSLIAMCMAMFTKEMTITLPFMVLLCETYFLRNGKRIMWGKLAPFILALCIIPVTMALTRSVDFVRASRFAEPLTPISPWHYLLTQATVIPLYVRLLFIPLDQNLDYDYPVTKSLADPSMLLGGLFLAGILMLALKMRARYKLISFGIFWFFITLIPESSIVPIKDVVAEHRLYLPMFGYGILLVSGMYYALIDKNARLAACLLALAVGWYSVLSYTRNFVWKDELTLWNDVVHKSPHKARPYYNRGLAYQNRGDLDSAMADFDRALQIKPDLYQAYNNRGVIYFDRGYRDRSLAELDRALAINPRYAESYNNRGVLHASEGNFDQALPDFNRAIEIDPAYVDAFANRATLYFKRHAYDKSWEDVCAVEKLGAKMKPGFLEQLKEASRN